MCLTIKEGQQPLIAQEDIVVWKVLRGDYSPVTGYEIKTKEGDMHSKYEEGRAYTSTIGVFGREIDRGFHSYKHKKYAVDTVYKPDRFCKFIIPTGATYYPGYQYDYNEGYVSDQIIFVKTMRKFLWWWI